MPDAYPSLHAMLLEACRHYAERPAFECLRVRMSYAEWERGSRDFAAFLLEEVNCRPGDRVAIMLPNMLAYPVTFLGTLRAGLTVVNVNPLYTPRELKEQLADSGASVIVIMENFAHKLANGHRRDASPPCRGGAARRFRADAQTLGVQFRQRPYQARRSGMAFRQIHDAAGRLQSAAERRLRGRRAAGDERGAAAIHGRNDGRAEGRDVDASQPRSPIVCNASLGAARDEKRTTSGCSRRCRSITSSR